MTDQLINPSPEEEAWAIRTCQIQNHRWATTLAGNEQEIDQLLTILTDLPTAPDYRSLHHFAVDYVGSLNLLKFSFQRLRVDMLCERACPSSNCRTCHDPRFGVYTLVDTHFRPLTDEFSRVRDGCRQFLASMVTLNLI